MPDEKVRERVIELRHQGYTYSEIASAVPCSHSYVEKTCQQEGLGGRIRKGGGVMSPLAPEEEGETPEDTLDAELLVERAKVESERAKKLYTAARRRIVELEDLRSVIADSLKALPPTRVARRAVPRRKSSGRHTSVLLISDPHVGEYVDAAALRDLGGYDWQTLRQEVGLLLERVVTLADMRRGRHRLDDLVVLMDGDMVSGEIHDDAIRTNEFSMPDAVGKGGQLFGHMVMQLAQHYNSVNVSCTVGNHGRFSKEPYYKQAAERNWDYLMYQNMAHLTSRQPNVTWDIPKSLIQITPVLNMNILHMHGHGIRSWMQISWYGLLRYITELRQNLAAKGVHFDVSCSGHVHQTFSLEPAAGQIVVNGGFTGLTEFAWNRAFPFVPRAQTLLTVHEERGIVGREVILLDDAKPEDAKGLPDALPEVWGQ